MSAYIRCLEVGSPEQPTPLYYCCEDTSDSLLTPFSTSFDQALGAVDKAVLPHLNTSYEDFTRGEANLSLTSDKCRLVHDALSALAQGEDITTDQKVLLFATEEVLGVIIGPEWRAQFADEMDSGELPDQVQAEGYRIADLDLVSFGGLTGWVYEKALTPVYIAASMRQRYPNIANHIKDEGAEPSQRRIAAAYFRSLADLAVGALYAAGADGDELALLAAQELNKIITDS